jgi:3-oxoacyl-(acyl-carrier-protein) synthase
LTNLELPDERPRVVITGAGVVCSLGSTPIELWEAIAAGRSGVGPITRFDASGFECRIAAEVPDADTPDERLDEDYWNALDRRSRFAVSAGLSALQHAGLSISADNSGRLAVVMASERPEEDVLLAGVSALAAGNIAAAASELAAHARPHAPSERIAALLGITGPTIQIDNRSAGGLVAIIEAADIIRRGDAHAAIAGGAEAPITPITLAAFQGTGALSTRNDDPQGNPRPLDQGRDGFVLGEGAAVVVLESLELARSRGATILAEVEGEGITFSGSEGGHPTTDPVQIGAALQRTLTVSGRIQSEIDMIAMHAAGTVAGDIAESTGIKRIFGASARHHLYTPALMSMTGHLLGASAALNVVIMLGALSAQQIPGTINLTDEDDECDLDANPKGTRDEIVRIVIVNSTGWAHNAALLLTHPDSMRDEDE